MLNLLYSSLNYKRSAYSSHDQHPITGVFWFTAQGTAAGVVSKKGYPTTYRLPTEYEWEVAVRASTSGEQYADTSLDTIHCNRQEVVRARHIGAYPPGRFGIYDLLGNIWEWTSSLISLTSLAP